MSKKLMSLAKQSQDTVWLRSATINKDSHRKRENQQNLKKELQIEKMK